MVTSGIVLGHVVSSKGIEVDKTKVELNVSDFSPQFLDENDSGEVNLIDFVICELKEEIRPLDVKNIVRVEVSSPLDGDTYTSHSKTSWCLSYKQSRCDFSYLYFLILSILISFVFAHLFYDLFNFFRTRDE